MDKIIDILSELHPEIDFNTTEDLIDDGILDSLDIVSIVAAVDTEFGVVIPAEEIVPENFNSAQALYELVMKLDEE